MQQGDRGFVVHLSPVSISTELAPHFNNGCSGWIFTSATLAVGDQFDHIRHSLGLNEAVIEKQFDSPFDYQDQVLAYIPEGLPVPGTDEHTRKLIEVIHPFLSEKSLLLFTSHRALKLASQILISEEDIPILYQGQLPKAELLHRFRQASKCVLLATQSFWEGIDLRGAGLRCLVIDKLPFASPADPVSRAMIKSITSAGGNGFMEYSLPQAIISLKQGFGRLIRQESDRGLFILGDPRVNSKSYGNLVLKSLPEMCWTDNEHQALAHLKEIHRSQRAASR
jgi:ATP-dependent DNA helicase DinG